MSGACGISSHKDSLNADDRKGRVVLSPYLVRDRDRSYPAYSPAAIRSSAAKRVGDTDPAWVHGRETRGIEGREIDRRCCPVQDQLGERLSRRGALRMPQTPCPVAT